MDKELIEAVAGVITVAAWKGLGDDDGYDERLAVAAIKAHNAYLADNGLVVVPREPTENMQTAAYALDECGCQWPVGVSELYEAMINAAQKENE